MYSECQEKGFGQETTTIGTCRGEYTALNPDSVAYESVYSKPSGVPTGKRSGEKKEEPTMKSDHYSSIDTRTLDVPGIYMQ